MPRKFHIILFLIVSLILFVGCQTLPGFNIFSSGQETDKAAPSSNFVDARQTIHAQVGQPLAIASYHRGEGKLTAVETSINGQPLRSEATAGQTNTFPDGTLATTAYVLVDGQPAQVSLQTVTFPSPACQNLLRSGGPVQTHSLPLSPPSSVWTVCHVWVSQTPGTYDLSLIAVDEAGRESEPIVQRIEVEE
ncbi:MAG: hypothetical protein HC875_35220 [Anaerolineales bacterium]|nr:hypothetical protein [Anaerolineales bacterium]